MAKLNKELHIDYLKEYLKSKGIADHQEFIELATGGHYAGNYRYSMVLQTLFSKSTKGQVAEWADIYINPFYENGKLNEKGKAVINSNRSLFGVKERL